MTDAQIVLIYVAADEQLYHQRLPVPMETTIREALHLSGWLDLPEFQTLKDWLNVTTDDTAPLHRAWHVGVFSQKQPLGYILKDGDRVEVYRPLALDPMKNRKQKLSA